MKHLIILLPFILIFFECNAQDNQHFPAFNSENVAYITADVYQDITLDGEFLISKLGSISNLDSVLADNKSYDFKSEVSTSVFSKEKTLFSNGLRFSFLMKNGKYILTKISIDNESHSITINDEIIRPGMGIAELFNTTFDNLPIELSSNLPIRISRDDFGEEISDIPFIKIKYHPEYKTIISFEFILWTP